MATMENIKRGCGHGARRSSGVSDGTIEDSDLDPETGKPEWVEERVRGGGSGLRGYGF